MGERAWLRECDWDNNWGLRLDLVWGMKMFIFVQNGTRFKGRSTGSRVIKCLKRKRFR